MSEPKHLVIARSYIGFQERPGNRGIEEFIGGAKAGRVGDAWCAIYANHCLEMAGIRGTRSALARSFERDGNFVRLSEPRLGCIVTFWRGSPTSGQGHVGFYISDGGSEINILSGNDSDQVQIDGHPRSRFTGYWWPKALIEGPTLAPKRFTDITATVFEDREVAYSDVRPGWNDRPGVALPDRLSGPRPKVRVTHRGKSVVCEIVDVGPWNTDDPYWTKSARPQAESGTDTRGRKTNKAGIDLTPAAADAIGLPGKGLVDWEFVTEELPMPTITDDAMDKLERLLLNLDSRLSRLEQQFTALPAPKPVEVVEPAKMPGFGDLFGSLFGATPSTASVASGGLLGLMMPILQMFGTMGTGTTTSTVVGTAAAGLLGGGLLSKINAGLQIGGAILNAIKGMKK